MVIGIIIGLVLLAAGALLLFLRGKARDKVLEIKSTATSPVSELHEIRNGVAAEIGPGGFSQGAEIKGTIECAEPLTAELSGTPCVWYGMSVQERYQDTYQEADANGRVHTRTRTGSNTVASNTRSVRFQVRDTTGTITVDPKRAKVEGHTVVDRHEPASGTESALQFGTFSFSLSPSPSGRKILGYHYTEQLIPLGGQVYVFGEASDRDGELVVREPMEKEKPFIISVRSEEEITQGLERSAALQQWFGFGLIAAGAAVAFAAIAGAFG